MRYESEKEFADQFRFFHSAGVGYSGGYQQRERKREKKQKPG